MMKLRQVESARVAIVAAAHDTQKLVVAALGVSVLALVLAAFAVVFAVRGRAAA